jgi:GT2 family glycosyltransferase
VTAAVAFEPAPQPVLSIVVVTYGCLEMVQRCLAAAADHTTLPAELVVVDNASPDGTADWVAGCSGVVLERSQRNEGFGPGANLGVARARGAYVALLNSDALVPPGWDVALVGALRRRADLVAVVPEYRRTDGVVAERGVAVDASGGTRQIAAESAPADREGAGRRVVLHGSAAAMVIRREAFVRAGGFDPAYGLGYYEDVDLLQRFQRVGLLVGFEPSVVVEHATGASSSDDTKRALIDRNRFRFAHRWGAVLRGTPAADDVDPGWWSAATVLVRGHDATRVRSAVAVALGLPFDVHVCVDGPASAPPGASSHDADCLVGGPVVTIDADDAIPTAAALGETLVGMGVAPRPPGGA